MSIMRMDKDVFEDYGQAVGHTYQLKGTQDKAYVAGIGKDSDNEMFYVYTVVIIPSGMPNYSFSHEIMVECFKQIIQGNLTEWIE